VNPTHKHRIPRDRTQLVGRLAVAAMTAATSLLATQQRPANAAPVDCPRQSNRQVVAAQPSLSSPRGIASLPNDSFLVANGGTAIVFNRFASWTYELDSATVSTTISDVDTTPDGQMFAVFTGSSNAGDSMIRQYQTDGSFVRAITRPSPTAPLFGLPTSVAAGPTGTFAIVDSVGGPGGTGAIHLFAADGSLIRTVSNAQPTPPVPAFVGVVDIAINSAGGIAAVEPLAHRVLILSPTGAVQRTITVPANAAWTPRRATFDSNGDLWVVADDGVNRFDATGVSTLAISNTAGTAANRPNPAWTHLCWRDRSGESTGGQLGSVLVRCKPSQSRRCRDEPPGRSGCGSAGHLFRHRDESRLV
jgi:hypothetical protein